MDKFIKNLEFLANHPKFIVNKLNKMSKVLSSHIHGIKSVEKEIENDSPENLRKHLHAVMMTTAAIAEDVYILNLISMMYLKSPRFFFESEASINNIMNSLESSENSDHIEVEDKQEEPIQEEKKEENEIKEETPSPVISEIPVTQKIEVTESISTVREEQPEQPVKKRRGRKKKIQIL